MSANFNNARKAPRDFGGKQGGGGFKKFDNYNNNKFDKKKGDIKKEVEAAPEKPISRREQKLRAELAASMAGEAAAMKGTNAPVASSSASKTSNESNNKNYNNNKKNTNNTGNNDKKKPTHPIVAAFGASSAAGAHESSYGKNAVDFCGKGHPFDRLQFGYSPSDNDEARAYHSQFSAKEWIKARTANYKHAIIKKQRLAKPNCESLTAMYKLKRYWASLNSANSSTLGGNIFDGAFAEDLLEQLASRQLRAEEGVLAEQ